MLYTDMLSLVAYLVSNGTTAVVTDAFKITSAPNTFFQGLYIPVGTSNSRPRYFLRGYEWNAGSNIACAEWDTSKWNLHDASGTTIYHQSTSTTNPWDAATWKDAGNNTVTVTFSAPNLTFTYGALTDTHTAMSVSGSSTGFNGIYLRGSDSNSKRQYFLVGTGTNNKRIQWSGSVWQVKDDSVTGYSSGETVTYPDQVVAGWFTSGNTDILVVTGINAYDLASGVNVQGNPSYDGYYVPQVGAYNLNGGHALVYRNISLGTVLLRAGDDPFNNWLLCPDAQHPQNPLSGSDTFGVFPWNAAWTVAGLTAQQTAIASPGQWS
jgi:hypothetical protein